jgi:hypothetical protein
MMKLSGFIGKSRSTRARGAMPRLICAGMTITLGILNGCTAKNPDVAKNSSPFASVRYAVRQDVELDLVTVRPGPDGFPIVDAVVRNLTNDQIVLEYGPGSVMLHCGDYFQRGPGATSALCREILDAFGYVEFAPVSGEWREKSPDGGVELMFPTHLPPGDYDLWVSFFSSKLQGGRLDSIHQIYRNPAGTPSH